MLSSLAEYDDAILLAKEAHGREIRIAQEHMYRELDPERYRAYSRETYRINSVRIIEYQHRYYRTNWDYVAARQKLYRETHVEETRTAQRNWRQANAVRIAAAKVIYAAEHREQIAAYKVKTRDQRLLRRRESYLVNRERVAIQVAAQYRRRKARALDAQGTAAAKLTRESAK